MTGILTKIQYLILPIFLEYYFNMKAVTNHITMKDIMSVISYRLLREIDKSGFGLKRDANIARHEVGFIISLWVDNACIRYVNPIIVLTIKNEIAIP